MCKQVFHTCVLKTHQSALPPLSSNKIIIIIYTITIIVYDNLP